MIKPDDIAKLARGLCGQLADETRIRCAVSRSYYAAFHHCQMAADQWCAPLTAAEEQDKGKHERLYARMQGHSKVPQLDAGLRTMAEQAKKLRNLRVTSDYDLSANVTKVDLDRGLTILRQVEQVAKALVNDANPAPGVN